jgi:hypothetical protein
MVATCRRMKGVDGFIRPPSLIGIANGVIGIEMGLLETIVGHHFDRAIDCCAFLQVSPSVANSPPRLQTDFHRADRCAVTLRRRNGSSCAWRDGALAVGIGRRVFDPKSVRWWSPHSATGHIGARRQRAG